MSWKPIETAPKDGTFFIGANTDEAIVCNWPRQRNCDYVPGNWKKEGKEWYGSSIGTSSPLTHWRALPELPLLSVEVAEGNGHSADASKMVGPALAPAGEVAELTAALRNEATNCTCTLLTSGDLRRIADLLERQAAPVPAPVSERLPQPEDCDAEGRCWVYQLHEACPECPSWELRRAKFASANYGAVCWLPAHALPLPSGEVQL